jgi:hypothetical protein
MMLINYRHLLKHLCRFFAIINVSRTSMRLPRKSSFMFLGLVGASDDACNKFATQSLRFWSSTSSCADDVCTNIRWSDRSRTKVTADSLKSSETIWYPVSCIEASAALNVDTKENLDHCEALAMQIFEEKPPNGKAKCKENICVGISWYDSSKSWISSEGESGMVMSCEEARRLLPFFGSSQGNVAEEQVEPKNEADIAKVVKEHGTPDPNPDQKKQVIDFLIGIRKECDDSREQCLILFQTLRKMLFQASEHCRTDSSTPIVIWKLSAANKRLVAPADKLLRLCGFKDSGDRLELPPSVFSKSFCPDAIKYIDTIIGEVNKQTSKAPNVRIRVRPEMVDS